MVCADLPWKVVLEIYTPTTKSEQSKSCFYRALLGIADTCHKLWIDSIAEPETVIQIVTVAIFPVVVPSDGFHYSQIGLEGDVP